MIKSLEHTNAATQSPGFDESTPLALAGIRRLSYFFSYLLGFTLFSPQLHLSNIEEVLVYFCLLLESELEVTHTLIRLLCAAAQAASLTKQL